MTKSSNSNLILDWSVDQPKIMVRRESHARESSRAHGGLTLLGAVALWGV